MHNWEKPTRHKKAEQIASETTQALTDALALNRTLLEKINSLNQDKACLRKTIQYMEERVAFCERSLAGSYMPLPSKFTHLPQTYN